MSDETNQLPAVLAVPENPPALVLPSGDLTNVPNAATQSWCSLVPVTFAEKRMVHTALSGNGLEFGEVMDVPLPLQNIAMQSKQVVDPESGEVRKIVVTTLMLTDGRVVAGSSSGIHGDVLDVFYSGWRPPFNPPLMVELYKVDAPRGKLFKLRVLSEGVDIDHEEIGQPLPKSKPKK